VVESLSSRFSQFLQFPIPIVRADDIGVVRSQLAHMAQRSQQILHGPLPLVAPESTEFTVNLVGDATLVSNFAEVVRSSFDLPILGGTTLSVVGDSSFLQFSLDHPPADIQELLHRWAQESGVQVISIARKAA